MNSEMTMTKNESATPSRMPVRISGSAAGSTTRQKSCGRRAPRPAAARKEDRVEEPEEDDEPRGEAPQCEEGEHDAQAQRERAPPRQRRAAKSPLHQVRHRAHEATSSTAAAVCWTYHARGVPVKAPPKAIYCARMGDLLLRQGLVDGRRQDVALRDGRIWRIGPALDPTGGETLDVEDK